MNLMTIGVSSTKDARRRVADALRGKHQSDYIWFASDDLLWNTLTPRRWQLLKLMAGRGPLAVREVARRAQRSTRAVQSDIHVLLDAGVVDSDPDGRVRFDYDAIHVDVDFVMRA
jgi:predicted transcriptional regulator